MATEDPIKHIVVLMLENHSFDQMLGWLKQVHPALDGVDAAHLQSNADLGGATYPQAATTATSVSPDPKHETPNVLRQLEGGNQGFVRDYSIEYPRTTGDQRQQIMAYFDRGVLPALDALAADFMVCDHWFSSVPGPTWANRFFVHSGTSKGRVQMPGDLWDNLHDPGLFLHYDQATIYDQLNDAGIPWRIYYGDIPQSLVLTHQQTIANARHYQRMSVFFSDAAGQEERFPAYSFIEPSYYWPGQNDDHPPHSTMKAQTLLAHVYNAIRKNRRLWEATLLVVLYDEHGGFYDHVPPPPAVPPDGHAEEYSFDRLGVRVPAVLVSPCVERGFDRTPFDHTSLLKYLCEKWRLAPLTARVAAAISIGGLIRNSGQPRDDTPESVPVPPSHLFAAVAVEQAEPLNENQRALLAFTEHLESQIHEPVGRPARMMAMATRDKVNQVAVAKDRIELFFAQQKARQP